MNGQTARLGWQPYVYLVYLGILVFQPIFNDSGAVDWLWMIALIVAFLPAYIYSFGRKGRMGTAAVWWMVLLGAVSLGIPLNTGGSVFFVYAAAAAPHMWSSRAAVRMIVALLGLTAILFFVSPISDPFRLATFVPAFVFIPLIGAVQIFEGERERSNAKLRRAHDEIEHIAAVAERERIARDLHDLLGHTLSVIRIKSELAGRLIDTDPSRARREIEDVERTARETLSEVRSAVQGYRTSGLTGEVASAKLALEASGVAFSYTSEPLLLPPRIEAALAYVVRESVTNVVRHAQATRCSVTLAVEAGEVLLEITDNGVGEPSTEGNGLGSLRERLRALGGEVEVGPLEPNGFRVRARAPLPEAEVGAADTRSESRRAGSGRLEAT